MKEKLDAYRSAFVIQIGILEGGAIFNAIVLDIYLAQKLILQCFSISFFNDY